MDNELITKELRRANESLKAAQSLLEAELFADAVSRAYYACLHGAKAALLTNNITASTHRAVNSLFGKHLVQKGKIEKEFGKLLKREQEDREASDYDVNEVFEISRAEQRVQEAERFVKRIEEFIKQN